MLDFVLDFLQPLVAVFLSLSGLDNLLVELLALLFQLANFFCKSVMCCSLQSFADKFQLVSLEFVLKLENKESILKMTSQNA